MSVDPRLVAAGRIEPAINVRAGTSFVFEAGLAAVLNGLVVASPFVLDEDGYYELFAVPDPGPGTTTLYRICVLDPADVRYSVRRVVQDGGAAPARLLARLPSSYPRRAAEVDRSAATQLELQVNQAAALALSVSSNRRAEQPVGVVLSERAGFWRSGSLDVPHGLNRFSASIAVVGGPIQIPLVPADLGTFEVGQVYSAATLEAPSV